VAGIKILPNLCVGFNKREFIYLVKDILEAAKNYDKKYFVFAVRHVVKNIRHIF